MVFSAWQGGGIITLVAGDGPPVSVTGQPIAPPQRKLYALEAGSWEEAIQQHHRIQEFGPAGESSHGSAPP